MDRLSVRVFRSATAGGGAFVAYEVPRMPAQTVAYQLNYQLAGQTVYSDGWANDYTWLGALFDAADMSPHFKLENLRALLSDTEADQWHVVKAEVTRERGAQRHRASADARLLQLTLLRLRGHA